MTSWSQYWGSKRVRFTGYHDEADLAISCSAPFRVCGDGDKYHLESGTGALRSGWSPLFVIKTPPKAEQNPVDVMLMGILWKAVEGDDNTWIVSPV